MSSLPGKVELIGVCYFPSNTVKKVIPNVIQEGVFCIEILLAGEVLYRDWTEQSILKRGTILWHQHNDETVWRCTTESGSFTSFAIRFKIVEPWERPGHIGHWYSMNELDEFVVNTMRHAFNPLVDKQILGNYLVNRLFWEFYAGREGSLKESLPVSLTKAIVLMQNEDIGELGIASIAEMVQISESHLYALFRKYFKSSPHQYLLNVRLKKARTFLSATDNPIKAVSEMCGFGSTATFHRQFQKAYGLTPLQFRRRHLALINSDIIKGKVEMQLQQK